MPCLVMTLGESCDALLGEEYDFVFAVLVNSIEDVVDDGESDGEAYKRL